MSVRVNLMVAEEFRTASAMSASFSPRVLAITGGAIAVTLLALGTVHYRSIRNGYEQAKARHAIVEPRFQEATRLQASRDHNRQIHSELDRWSTSGVHWADPLEALAGLVPANMQFTRLTIESTIEKPRILPAPAPTKEEGKEKGKGKDKGKAQAEVQEAKAPPPPPSMRRYTIRIDGSASGELSDQTVVDFVKTLRESAAFADWIESVQLQGLQKSATPNAGAEDRVFRIDLRTKTREL